MNHANIIAAAKRGRGSLLATVAAASELGFGAHPEIANLAATSGSIWARHLAAQRIAAIVTAGKKTHETKITRHERTTEDAEDDDEDRDEDDDRDSGDDEDDSSKDDDTDTDDDAAASPKDEEKRSKKTKKTKKAKPAASVSSLEARLARLERPRRAAATASSFVAGQPVSRSASASEKCLEAVTIGLTGAAAERAQADYLRRLRKSPVKVRESRSRVSNTAELTAAEEHMFFGDLTGAKRTATIANYKARLAAKGGR